MNTPKYQFWIDRGGTFTDVVAITPQGEIRTHKLLSENLELYPDASLQGIRDILKLKPDQPIPAEQISVVKMGTTLATNALLERQGEPLVLVTNHGLKDILKIGYQNRPDIFSLEVTLPDILYNEVITVDARYDVHGAELAPLNEDAITTQLQSAYQKGYKAIAIVLLHSYAYPDHEKRIAQIAHDIGFSQISASHEVNPLMKIVSRGDTTVVDAYLTPLIKQYVNTVSEQLNTTLFFIQSNGGLAEAHHFRGKDSILSGPAAGVVGAVNTAKRAGFEKIVSFDMGGTSTDVALYDGEYQRAFETQIAGVRCRSAMLNIHTVAAGGGSILHFKQDRYQVGPDSAGANPGPACYGNAGPLTVTDCNLMLGRLQPHYFPAVFGVNANEPLNKAIVEQQFNKLATDISTQTQDSRTPAQVAYGYLQIAVDNMANAIKKVSMEKGFDVTQYTLCCFGGAGGQHACQVADRLGMESIYIHPNAGVLSALGMGFAEITVFKEKNIERLLSQAHLKSLSADFDKLTKIAHQEIAEQNITNNPITDIRKCRLKYRGTDTAISIPYGELDSIIKAFEHRYKQLYGFASPEADITIESIQVQCSTSAEVEFKQQATKAKAKKPEKVSAFFDGEFKPVPVYRSDMFTDGDTLTGPVIIAHAHSTTVIESNWQLTVKDGQFILSRMHVERKTKLSTQADPVMLEVFNNLFMSVAEEMGITLGKTAHSVNIKERLDYSCAIFNAKGDLIANAHHIPVHLGSMSDSVKTIIHKRKNKIHPGDVYMLNDPYHGGTHLPDITIITPVFAQDELVAFTASRAHQADIGGITPGSVPPHSQTIDEEGVLIDNFTLVDKGEFREEALKELLCDNKYPVRNYQQNRADITAQIAANEKGRQELSRLFNEYGLDVVLAYMQHVQDNAEASVRELIPTLKSGSFSYENDNKTKVAVDVSIATSSDSATQTMIIDFTGSSPQQDNNFNAPTAVVKAAVIYVLRTLIKENIPINEGFLKPIELKLPDDCFLNPQYPAAVVAGNVETSQCIVDALYGALGVMAASQGTMNNLTFGNEQYQYYETICGGTGAGPGFHGTDAVHSHMTNTRLTDPEVLESRFPVLVEQFEVRQHSAGNGKWHGGNGVIRALTFLQPMTVGILSNRRIIPPYGMHGGTPAKPGKNIIKRADGTTQTLNSSDTVELNKGDTIIIETPGGGGYSHLS